MSIPTPHISAKKEDIAKTVLMPGDPLRSKFIAENLLDDIVLVNNVRGVQGYTGTYNGKKVTVMASGMGNPSIGIYSYELFNFYDVDNIIRVGTMGSMQENIKARDVIISKRCYSNTNYFDYFIKNGNKAGFIDASEELVNKAVEKAKELNMNCVVGDIYCSDTFYTDIDQIALAKEHNLIGVEMESSALYINAKNANKNALTICTISDELITGVNLPSEVRQKEFLNMMKLALELI